MNKKSMLDVAFDIISEKDYSKMVLLLLIY